MEKIRKYIENLFEDAPKSKEAFELKEEFICDLSEKYNDLIKDGKEEKVAFDTIIAGIGNIDELISSLNNVPDYKNEIREQKKTALVVSLCVGLYILSMIVTILTDEIGLPEYVSAISFVTIAGIATCILIYHFMSKPRNKDSDGTVVQEFKEWKDKKNKHVEIKKAISSILWTSITAIYLLISFLFGIWYISWIIFIIGAIMEAIIDLILKIKE